MRGSVIARCRAQDLGFMVQVLGLELGAGVGVGAGLGLGLGLELGLGLGSGLELGLALALVLALGLWLGGESLYLWGDCVIGLKSGLYCIISFEL